MIPKFKYHPDPIATGAIKKNDSQCECCGENRGYTYTATLYSPEEIEFICPWCIADGSAAQKFDGMFCDDYPLIEANLNNSIIDEVTLRTPGFNSWQQEEWLVCCEDACEFHGDATKNDFQSIGLSGFQSIFNDKGIKQDFFDQFKASYPPVSA